MTPERWRQIEGVFNAAADRPFDERDAFLRQACNADDELRNEVESLLAHEVSEALLQAPIKGAASSLVNRDDESITGSRIGVYRVTGLIGPAAWETSIAQFATMINITRRSPSSSLSGEWIRIS